MKIKKDLVLMGHPRAALINWNFFKPQVPHILNLNKSNVSQKVCEQGAKFKQKLQDILEFSSRERERQRETERDRKREREIHLHSMDERLKEIWHSMSMALHTRKSNFRSRSGLQFHVCFTITVYNKIRLVSSQNEKATILQNTTNVYYKIRQAFYCKMWQFYSECKLLHSR